MLSRTCAISTAVLSTLFAGAAVSSAGTCPGTTDVSEGSQMITDGASVVCYGASTPAQHFARMHDLSTTALAGTPVEIHCVTWGFEFTSADLEAQVAIFTSDSTTPNDDDMVFMGSTVITIAGNAANSTVTAVFSPPIYVDADALVFVELAMPLAAGAPAYAIGANTGSQTSASWINTSGECGINGWTDLADIGYPQVSWVESMNASPTAGPNPCDEPLDGFPADIDNDGDCDVDDLLQLLSSYGQVGDGTFRPVGDIHPQPNGDCDVDVDDLLTVLANFGTQSGACCVTNIKGSTCFQTPGESYCTDQPGGVWYGLGTTCDDIACPPDTSGAVMLNELRANQSGTDTDEYFELIGEPGTSLDGLTLIAIGDGSGDSPNGIIEEAVDLSGFAINAAGFFVVGEPEMIIGTPDYAYELNFESGDQVTFMLVSGFTGVLDQDLDFDDDGVLDDMPWDAAIDCVAFVEVPDEYSDLIYCTTTVGPDDIYTPGGARKCPDTDGDWFDNGFFPGDFVDTPGGPNDCDFTDSDGDGVIDSQDNCPDLANPDQADCDGDGIGDLCAIADGLASDCNENTIPDNCEDDCNLNGYPDDCDIADGVSTDCDSNGIPDECDPDCNGNGVADPCDIANGTSADDNGNGVPDECEGEVFTINEIHADPAADISGDANADGVRDGSEDEFIEIVNMTGSDVFMGGWQIHDAVGLRHEIAGDVVLGPGCALVVFGGGDPADFGSDFGGATIEVASTGYLGFNNSGDTASLFDAGGGLVTEMVYGSEGGDNQSLTRSPDVFGTTFYKHSTVASDGALFSPGTMIEGDSFGGDCGGGGGEDSDGDGVPDEYDNCDLYNPDQADCNDNGIGDVCDLADGTSVDKDGNGIPDECEELVAGAFINELHYDNASTDVDEMIEVVLLDGVDPGTVTVTLYNGNGAVPYGSALNVGTDFTAGESGTNWAIYSIILPANGLQNGAPDGLCIDIGGSVAEFLSYEGTMTAVSGPAAGLTSIDIGVAESSGTSIGSSLGLTGATPFSWAVFADLATPGMVNDGQTIE